MTRKDRRAPAATKVERGELGHIVRVGPKATLRAPRRAMRRTALSLLFALLLAFVLGGCQSEAARAFRGARHYAAGSEALERGASARAVFELSLAAELVPHASEIQNHLGLAYLAEGDVTRARRAFERAVELDCDNAAAAANRARLDFRESFSAAVPPNTDE